MSLYVKVKPPFREAAEELERAFRTRSFVLVIGTCKVDYEGRASSTLDLGERLVIIKQDGSVLVHRPVGYEPVNWQPPKCMLKVNFEDSDSLTVTAARLEPRETVSMEFRDIAVMATCNLKDAGEFALHVTEAQMKEAILAVPELVEQGLRPLQEEKSLGEAGFTDIYAEDSAGNLVVVEIKRNPATKGSLTQLKRYIDTIRKRTDRPIRGIVVAPDLRKSAQPLLHKLQLEYVMLPPERCLVVLKGRKETKLSEFLS